MPLNPEIPLSVKSQTFGNTPFEVLGQMQQLQAQRQVIQSNQALEEQRRSETERRQRLQQMQDAVDKIMAHNMKPDPVSGVMTFDRSGFTQEAMQSQHGSMLMDPGLTEHIDQLDKATKAAHDAQNSAIAEALYGVEKAGHSPAAAIGGISYLAKNRLMTPPQMQQALEALAADPSPDGVKALVAKFGANNPQYRKLSEDEEKRTAELAKLKSDAEPKPFKLSPGEIQFDPYGGEIARGGEKEPTHSAIYNEYVDAKQQGFKGSFDQYQTMDANRKKSVAAIEDEAISLTPEALKLTAHQYAMTGQLPPMGMGKKGAAVRTQIINEAAKIYENLDLPTQVAAYNANKASLATMQKQRDAVGAFEETAVKNLDTFLSAAQKVVDTKSPWLNKPLRSIAGTALGSADQAAFNAARQAVVPEFGKLLGNPSLSGQLTDSQRKEIDTILNPDATLAQIYASAKVLKQDATNRKQSLDDGIKAIQGRIATPPGGAKADSGIEEWVRDPATGKLKKR